MTSKEKRRNMSEMQLAQSAILSKAKNLSERNFAEFTLSEVE